MPRTKLIWLNDSQYKKLQRLMGVYSCKSISETINTLIDESMIPVEEQSARIEELIGKETK